MKEDLKCELIGLYAFLGKKWSVALFHNINSEHISFNELQKLTRNKISSRLLSQRLKSMEKFQLIKKENIKDKITYSVSEKGLKLKKILHEIKDLAIDSNYEIPEYCKHDKCYCDVIFKE